jgi:predicted small secreted protein
MKRLFVLSVAALLFGIAMAGCQNTAEGAKQDASNDTAAVKEAGDKAAVATANAAKDAERGAKQAADATADATQKAAVKAEKGAKEAAIATQAAAQNVASDAKAATDRVVSAADKAGKNASDAVTLTPKVKLAITNDPGLNNTANLINVDSGNDQVQLKGHVISKQLKMRAENIARKAVKDAGSNDKVVNNLTVQGQ